MNKLKVFLSSRVNSPLTNLDSSYTLEALRRHLRAQLEAERFLGEQMLQVIINEESFDGTITKDAFSNCLDTMRSCNIIVILYNGEAGWSVSESGNTNGICHDEFLLAMELFSGMTFIMDISEHFSLDEANGKAGKNRLFRKEVADSYLHMEQIRASSVEELQANALKQIKRYIHKAIGASFKTQKQFISGSTVHGQTLDWNKLNYAERREALLAALEPSIEQLAPFSNVIKACYAIPDNMSVTDARNLIGRPFLHEHELVKKAEEQSGVIHFVAVYGSATETQLKNMVGYPDLAVIKAPFGFYLWEKNMHIQMFFLKGCLNPQKVNTRISEIIHWLTRSKEESRIIARASARYSILDAVNRAKNTAGI